MHNNEPDNYLNRLLRYALYPALFAIMAGYAYFELQAAPDQLGRYYGYYVLGLIGTMITIESLHPMRTQWKMTKQTFFRRDLPFLLLGAATLGGVNYVAGVAIIQHGIAHGSAHAGMSLIPGVVLALLTGDFIWYWVHRFSHEARGRLGQVLWKIHVAHHLPQQVYVLMHAVAHPINAVTARACFAVPLFFLGFSPEVLFLANLIIGLQGLVSHFNVDIRVGWLNYLVVGTELHRNHHSADPQEAKNYGAVVPLWDQLFGTFFYRPNTAPQCLGLEQPMNYPNDQHILKILALPFNHARD